MYEILAKLLNGETLELIGFRVKQNATENIKYFSVDNVVTLIQQGKVVNAKLSTNGQYITKRLRVNKEKIDKLESYYAVGGNEFISEAEYKKRGTPAEKVEKCIQRIEEEKRKELEAFKESNLALENSKHTEEYEMVTDDLKIYIGIRRLDYKKIGNEESTQVSLRVYTTREHTFNLSRLLDDLGYAWLEEWKVDRIYSQYVYTDLYYLTTGQARSVIEYFGGTYCAAFENEDDCYALVNMRLKGNVYLGRVHLPENDIVLISGDKVENTELNEVRVRMKSITTGYSYEEKFRELV